MGLKYCKSTVQSTHGIEVRVARAEGCLVYWDFAPIAELNGQIGPVWILELTVARVIMSVRAPFRRLYIAYDSMVACGDSNAIIGLKGTLLVHLLADLVTIVGIRQLFLLRTEDCAFVRVCRQPKSDFQPPYCTQHMRMY
jgi:hypothetical protein